ncbi:hypothetical protein SCHPADRAFT_804134, partial [Schizopora paradoxa]
IRQGYSSDPFWKKIKAAPEQFKAFTWKDGLVYTTNPSKAIVLGIPNVKFGKRNTIGVLLEVAHQTLGHMGAQRTEEYVRRFYWW